jgi:hypothetical protein
MWSNNEDTQQPVYCDMCGAVLTQDEFEEFEDTCYNCIMETTQGIISDKINRTLR